jgi:hypothetical protein
MIGADRDRPEGTDERSYDYRARRGHQGGRGVAVFWPEFLTGVRARAEPR